MTDRTSIRTRRFVVLCTAVTTCVVLAVPAAAATGHERENTYRQANLVSDVPGLAPLTDPNLVNPWGLALSPTSPLWVANNGTSTATIYRSDPGSDRAVAQPLVVGIPGSGSPTGQVYNDTTDFVVSGPGGSGPARFLFAGEDGDLSGWNPTASVTAAVLTASVPGAIFKGLALVHRPAGNLLLVANFHDNRIEIFDGQFRHLATGDRFRDRRLPAGYAPFNVAAIGGLVYVTYAKQDATGEDDVAGPGFGFLDVYSSSGRLLRRLVSRGVLNAPWGLTVAPPGFGEFSGDLLVGNFGDGRISAFDREDGELEGQLRDSHGSPIAIEGLWGLLVGNDAAGGRNAVWFSAGIDDEAHGLLGLLHAG